MYIYMNILISIHIITISQLVTLRHDDHDMSNIFFLLNNFQNYWLQTFLLDYKKFDAAPIASNSLNRQSEAKFLINYLV